MSMKITNQSVPHDSKPFSSGVILIKNDSIECKTDEQVRIEKLEKQLQDLSGKVEELTRMLANR